MSRIWRYIVYMQKKNKILIITSLPQTKKSISWGFSFNEKKELIFNGKSDEEIDDFSQWKVLNSSSYFSPAWYKWLPSGLCSQIKIAINKSVVNLKANHVTFLTHIGALLLAVENNDGLLCAELFNRRSDLFSRFSDIVSSIIKPIAPEALFAWLYGKFTNENEFLKYYYLSQTTNEVKPENIIDDIEKKESVIVIGKPASRFGYRLSGIESPKDILSDTSIFFFNAAKDELQPNPASETPNQMFVRYFQKRKQPFTIGIVGSNFRRWAENTTGFVDSVFKSQIIDDIKNNTCIASSLRNSLYESAAVSVQIEPGNQFDANAISVSLESLENRYTGQPSLLLAGYLRSSCASILRIAFPEKLNYSSSLFRIGNFQDGAYGIVINITL